MTTSPHVQLAIDGALAIITLDRPDARNAYSTEMCEQLVQALDDAERHEAVRCAIVTGAGKAFHAGGGLRVRGARSVRSKARSCGCSRIRARAARWPFPPRESSWRRVAR